jgi:outer membrane protein assembly factor BamB
MLRFLPIGFALLAAAAFATSDVSAATGDWPQYGFTAHGRRENTQETILTRKTVPHLVQKWTANINLGQSPAAMVVNGIVYASGTTGGLYALDAGTGTQLWKADASSVPAVADGVVYAGSRDGNVYALDAETGAVRWKAPAGVVGPPISVVRGVVYAGTDDGHTVAIDARTGSIKWSNIAAQPPRDVVSAPAVADGVVVARSEGGVLSAFDARTGASLWTTQHPGNDFTSQPVSIKGTVYITDDWYLYAFDTKTGQTRWQTPAGDTRSSSIAMDGGHIYLKEAGGRLETFDATTGQLLSYSQTGRPPMDVTPALANGVLYISGTDNIGPATTAYDAHTGKQLWQDTSTGGTPTIANGMLYVATNGSISAYGLP